MEIWDIFDADGNPKGYTHQRGKPVADGDYHIVAEVFITTPDKRLLLMRRHPDKPFGNSWELTGGSVVSGEDSLTAIQRELYEETGIDLKKEAFEFIKATVGNHAIYHFYHAEADITVDDIILQENETVGAVIVTAEEYRELAEKGELCQPSRERYFEYILKELEG